MTRQCEQPAPPPPRHCSNHKRWLQTKVVFFWPNFFCSMFLIWMFLWRFFHHFLLHRLVPYKPPPACLVPMSEMWRRSFAFSMKLVWTIQFPVPQTETQTLDDVTQRGLSVFLWLDVALVKASCRGWFLWSNNSLDQKYNIWLWKPDSFECWPESWCGSVSGSENLYQCLFQMEKVWGQTWWSTSTFKR